MRSVKNTQRKASTVHNIWMLKLVVRKETARLLKVMVEGKKTNCYNGREGKLFRVVSNGGPSY